MLPFKHSSLKVLGQDITRRASRSFIRHCPPNCLPIFWGAYAKFSWSSPFVFVIKTWWWCRPGNEAIMRVTIAGLFCCIEQAGHHDRLDTMTGWTPCLTCTSSCSSLLTSSRPPISSQVTVGTSTPSHGGQRGSSGSLQTTGEGGRWDKERWKEKEREKRKKGLICIPYSGKFSRVQIFAKILFPLQEKFSRLAQAIDHAPLSSLG